MTGRTNGSGSSAVIAPPDALGQTNRVKTIANMFVTVQNALYTLEVEQVANGLEDGDPAPNFVRPDGSAAKTVAQRRRELEESQRRLIDHFAPLMPEVEKLLNDNIGSGKAIDAEHAA